MPGASLTGIEFVIKGNADSASNSVKKLTDSLTRLKSVLSKDISKFAKFGGKNIGKLISAPLRQATTNAVGFAKGLSGILGGFKRIVGYRIIRSVIKEITQGFQEGIKNLYGWSAAFGGALIHGKNFKETMDGLATSTMYLKNSIGAAAAPFISALAPAIDYVIDKAVALLNVINQLMALFSGATSWNRAIKKTQEYGDAVGGAGAAAKEALRYLAPFDELNRLPDENRGGGGGGGGTDYSGMFEETTEFMEGLKDFADTLKEKINQGDWHGVGVLLGNKVNEIVDSIPWNTMGAKVGSFINALFTTRYWTLETINFQNIGAKVAEFLNNAIANIDFDIIGRTITQKFTIIGDFIIGAVQNIDWGSVGQAIGNFVRGAFNQMSEWFSGVDWQSVGYSISSGIVNAISNLDVLSLGESLFNFFRGGFQAAFDLLVGAVEGLFQPVIDAINTFVESHPFIAGLLGLGDGGTSGGWGAMGGSGNFDFSGTVDVEANVTGIKDNIPLGQKVIDGVKGIFGSTDNGTGLSTSDRTIDARANFISRVLGFPSNIATSTGMPVFGSQAKFISRLLNFPSNISTSSGMPLFNSQANFISRALNFPSNIATSSGLPLFKSTANFISRQLNFPSHISTSSGLPLFNSQANFTSRKTDSLNTTFSSAAEFVKAFWASWFGRPDMDANAEFRDCWWRDGTPTVQVYAAMTPINNPGYVMGGYGAKGGIWGARGKIADIPQYASGGRVHGSLFLAGEAGAEIVGHIGGRTEVLNRSQLAATMYSAVRSAMSGIAFNVSSPSMGASATDDGASEDMLYRAFLRALNDSDFDDRPIELDGAVVYNKIVQRNRMERQRTGMNPMLSY